MAVWELRGNFPDVPTFPDVDIESLTAGDENPVYLTLPIGEAGVTSRNKKFYDEAFVTELARQTQDRKPVGYMGHEKGKGMEWPEDDVHWVGAKLIGNQLWGKAYISSEDARKRARLYKATNKPMATSIYAHMGLNWDAKLGAYRAQADSLDLHRIDLGPLDMAGIQSLAKVPHMTAELINNPEEQITMDKLQLIRELTVEDVDLIPKPVREAITAAVPAAPEVALVTELRAELGEGDILATVKEWKQERETGQKTAVTERIKQLATDKERGVKVDSVRSVVLELVQGRNPATPEAAESAYDEIVKSELVTELLKTAVVSAGGPPLRTGVQNQNGNPVDQWFPVTGSKESA
jgi:hypothetical protein